MKIIKQFDVHWPKALETLDKNRTKGTKWRVDTNVLFLIDWPIIFVIHRPLECKKPKRALLTIYSDGQFCYAVFRRKPFRLFHRGDFVYDSHYPAIGLAQSFRQQLLSHFVCAKHVTEFIKLHNRVIPIQVIPVHSSYSFSLYF